MVCPRKLELKLVTSCVFKNTSLEFKITVASVFNTGWINLKQIYVKRYSGFQRKDGLFRMPVSPFSFFFLLLSKLLSIFEIRLTPMIFMWTVGK